MKYSLTLILNSAVKESDKKKTIDNIKSFFEKAKITEKIWGQKPLAYPIKKEVSGYFVSYEIETDGLPNDFEKKLISNDDILRHLLLRSKQGKGKAGSVKKLLNS